MDSSTFSPNNCLNEDETLDQAYDIFLELAPDNLDPADIILFNLQFEDNGAAELTEPTTEWSNHVDFEPDPNYFSEVVIGLTDEKDEIADIFARILICREKDNKFCHIIWKK